MKYVGLMNVNLQQIEAFLTVAEYQNMTRAAGVLNVSQSLVSQKIIELRKLHPNITVELSVSSELREQLINEETDVVLQTCYEDTKLFNDINYYVIKVKKFVVVMRKEHPLAKKEKLEWKDLSSAVIYCQPPSKTGEYERKLHAICEKNGFSPHIVTCNNLFSAELNMSIGFGIVVGVLHSVDYLDNSDYASYEMDDIEVPVVTACLKRASPEVKEFAKKAAIIAQKYI